MSCSKLEQIANQAREQMLSRNNYSEVNLYDSTHPDATQETTSTDPNNYKGRGTGRGFDTSFEAGNFFDKQARQALSQNQYTVNTPYETPDC